MVDRTPGSLIAQVYCELIRAGCRPRILSHVKDYSAVSTTGDENTGRLRVPVEIPVIPDPTIIRNRDFHCTGEAIQALHHDLQACRRVPWNIEHIRTSGGVKVPE